MNKKGELKMNGITILGICLILVSLFSIIYGATLYPINLLDSKFMSFTTGGVIFTTIGLCIISGIPISIKLIAVWFSVLTLIVYIYGMEMDLVIKLISFIPVVGFGVWITTRIIK